MQLVCSSALSHPYPSFPHALAVSMYGQHRHLSYKHHWHHSYAHHPNLSALGIRPIDIAYPSP